MTVNSNNACAERAVAALISQAKQAQKVLEPYSQQQVDEVVAAIGWALIDPGNSVPFPKLRLVKNTGLGHVDNENT